MMMNTYVRKLLALLATGALLLGMLAYLPGDTSAANLTGGTYTYVISGEEVTFTVDPISRKDGLLLPTEVFERFGITLEGTLTKTVSLKRFGMVAKVSLGNPIFDLDGKAETLPTSAMRLNGRVFLPADLLKYFGVEYGLDGTFLSMRDITAGLAVVKTTTAEELAKLRSEKSFSIITKADTNIYFTADYTLLNQEILQSSSLDLSFATRVRLLNMLQSNTLLMVKISNREYKSGTLVTAGLFLVDTNRRQYDVASIFDIGEGLLNTKLAPGADRTGVLVYPKVSGSGILNVYYDTSGFTLGTVINP